MAFLAGKRIGISGAGVGGTAFALALEQACKARGISPLPAVKIFERDASPSARENLGYSFSLKESGEPRSGGLKVIRQLERGILEELEQLREPGQDSHICWQTFQQPLIRIGPDTDERRKPKALALLRIMRSRLRQVLLARVPPENVQYGKACVFAVPAAEAGQPVQLAFADGSGAECDLLVVADGTNSKLRAALLPHEANRYAGVCMLFGRTRPLDQLPRELQQGHYLVLGKASCSTALFMGSVDKNTVMWSLSSRMPQSQAAELSALLKDPAAAQEYMEHEVPKLADGFSEPLPSVLRETDAASLTALPAIDRLPHAVHDNGVVYIGDAWHPMPPFAGAGANMALQDAWELAQELVNGGHDSAQAAISQYAANASQRSVDAINGGRRNIALAHSEGWKKLLCVAAVRSIGILMRLVSAVRSAGNLISGKAWSPFAQKSG